MEVKKPKVVSFVVKGHSGCDYYRTRIPFKHLSKVNPEEVRFHLIEEDNLKRQDLKTLKAMDESDVWVFGRMANASFYDRIDKAKVMIQHPVEVMLDFDDDMFGIMPLNPAYKDWGLSNIWYKDRWIHKDGETITGEDPKGNPIKFSIERNKGNQESLIKCLRKADWVLVTTEILEKTYGKYNLRARALPNLVDTDLWGPLDIVKRDEIRIGWAGGASHYEDLVSIIRNLTNIVNKHNKVKLVVIGQRFPFIEQHIKPKNYEFHSWVGYEAYPYLMKSLNLDIGICPLIESKFNRNKSAIKWMEYSALGLASVVADVYPYKGAVRNNETALTYYQPKEFENAVERLVEDKELRLRLGKQAQDEVIKNHSWQNNVDKWFKFFLTR